MLPLPARLRRTNGRSPVCRCALGQCRGAGPLPPGTPSGTATRGHSRFGGSLQRCAASASRADRAGCCRTERRGAPLGHLCACNTTVGSAVAGGGNGRCADTRARPGTPTTPVTGLVGAATGAVGGAVAPVTTTVAPVTAPVTGVTAPVPVTGVTAPVAVTGVTAQPNAVTAPVSTVAAPLGTPTTPVSTTTTPPTTAPAPVTTTTAPATSSIGAGKLPS